MAVLIPMSKRLAVPRGQVPLDSAGATWVDTGTRLSGAPTYTAGVGWSLNLTGGWSATDPFDGPYVIYPPITSGGDGAALALTDLWAATLSIIERTAPDLNSDIAVYGGFCNEAVDSGTIDAVWWAIRYTGGSRSPRKGQIANGTATGTDGTADATIRIMQSWALKFGSGASARWQSPTGRALDSAGAPIAAAAYSTTDHGCTGGDLAPRPFLGVGRLSITDATTRSLVFDVSRGPVIGTTVRV